eukprot:UN2586
MSGRVGGRGGSRSSRSVHACHWELGCATAVEPLRHQGHPREDWDLRVRPLHPIHAVALHSIRPLSDSQGP